VPASLCSSSLCIIRDLLVVLVLRPVATILIAKKIYIVVLTLFALPDNYINVIHAILYSFFSKILIFLLMDLSRQIATLINKIITTAIDISLFICARKSKF
jgi:hypothetical protein